VFELVEASPPAEETPISIAQLYWHQNLKVLKSFRYLAIEHFSALPGASAIAVPVSTMIVRFRGHVAHKLDSIGAGSLDYVVRSEHLSVGHVVDGDVLLEAGLKTGQGQADHVLLGHAGDIGLVG
jgi:hypothetical protein